MAALLHQLAISLRLHAPEQDGAALQLSLPDHLPRRVLGALSLRTGAARAPRGRAADGHGARRRVLRAADDDGERAGAGRVAALPAHAGVDGDARGRNGRGAVSAPRGRGAPPARARHGPGHAAAEAPGRSLRGVHAGRVCLHRARPRDCDDGRHRARGAGARAVHLPADAHHRRRRRAAREPARLGPAAVRILPRPLRGRDAAGDGHRQRARAPRASARWRSSSSASPAASPARRCSGGIQRSGSRPRRARPGWRSRWPRGSASASWPRRQAGEGWLAPWPGRCQPPRVRNRRLRRRHRVRRLSRNPLLLLRLRSPRRNRSRHSHVPR